MDKMEVMGFATVKPYIDNYLEAGTRRAGVEELTMILPPWSIERERVGSLLMWF